MGFRKLTEDEVICVYCGKLIAFGDNMEFALPAPDGVRPAHQTCNEKAYAEAEETSSVPR
jgi:hypothetical protein